MCAMRGVFVMQNIRIHRYSIDFFVSTFDLLYNRRWITSMLNVRLNREKFFFSFHQIGTVNFSLTNHRLLSSLISAIPYSKLLKLYARTFFFFLFLVPVFDETFFVSQSQVDFCEKEKRKMIQDMKDLRDFGLFSTVKRF